IAPLIAAFTRAHESASTTIAGLTDGSVEITPNEELDQILVRPRVRMLKTEEGSLLSRGVISLLRDLESTLTATYINAVSVVLESSDRKALMAHGGAAARRATLLADGGAGRLPEAIYPPTDLVPGDVLVDEEDVEEDVDEDAEGEGDDS